MAGRFNARMRRVVGALLIAAVTVVPGIGSAAVVAPAQDAGPRIAFARSTAPGDDGASSEIFTVAEDGTDLRRLTSNGVEDTTPAFSPDGGRLAFTRTRRGVSQIFVMDHDGSNVRRLTSGTRSNALPDWSPDGAWIVFTRFFDAQQQSELFKVRSGGGTPVRLTKTPSREFAPEWSPDGRLVTYTVWNPSRELAGIGVMRPGGRGRRVLVNNPRAAQGYTDFNPAWSTNSRRVAFAREVRGLAIDIFTIRADGTGLRRLTRLDGEAQLPSYSADGRIAFMHDGGISVMRADGTGVRTIVAPTPPDRPPSPASWPDWAHAAVE